MKINENLVNYLNIIKFISDTYGFDIMESILIIDKAAASLSSSNYDKLLNDDSLKVECDDDLNICIDTNQNEDDEKYSFNKNESKTFSEDIKEDKFKLDDDDDDILRNLSLDDDDDF